MERITSKAVYGGGANKEQRVRRAVREYLAAGRDLAAKVSASLLEMCDQPVEVAHWDALVYFHAMLEKHLGLVERRLLKEETIPAAEKVFSLFEPHTSASPLTENSEEPEKADGRTSRARRRREGERGDQMKAVHSSVPMGLACFPSPLPASELAGDSHRVPAGRVCDAKRPVRDAVTIARRFIAG